MTLAAAAQRAQVTCLWPRSQVVNVERHCPLDQCSSVSPRGQAQPASTSGKLYLPYLPGVSMGLSSTTDRCLWVLHASRNEREKSVVCVKIVLPSSGPGSSELTRQWGSQSPSVREDPRMAGTTGLCGVRKTKWGHGGPFSFGLASTIEMVRPPSNLHILSTYNHYMLVSIYIIFLL